MTQAEGEGQNFQGSLPGQAGAAAAGKKQAQKAFSAQKRAQELQQEVNCLAQQMADLQAFCSVVKVSFCT